MPALAAFAFFAALVAVAAGGAAATTAYLIVSFIDTGESTEKLTVSVAAASTAAATA